MRHDPGRRAIQVILGTLVWPNGADFDHATVHDWPDLETKLVEMARSWARRQA